MSKQSGKGAKILNIIKTVLIGVIAVTMVKFAFFPSAANDEAVAPDPTADYGSITITPEIGTITNSIKLEGTIQSDPAATVKATLSGEVREIYVTDGQQVAEGETLMWIRKEIPPEPVTPAPAAEGEAPAPFVAPQPTYENAWIAAPSAGKVSLTALVSQQVSVGDAIASVQPPTFSAVANVTPDQMYRVQNLPEKATITIKNGPAPFECHGVRIETPQNRGVKPGETATQSSTAIEARCAIASEHRVFPGLQVTMNLVAGEATDVLTVPVSAVEGRFETGFVYTPGVNGGEPEKLAVKLGVTDGKRIEIIEGLSEGQEILEFVPGKQVERNQFDPGFGGYGDPAMPEEYLEGGAEAGVGG